MARRGTEVPRGMAAVARWSEARHRVEALRGMAAAEWRSRAGGRNREAAIAEASGEFIS
jgi:hypothetical protein